MGSLKGSKQYNFQGHGDRDRKNSWYWNVLVKNMGSWKEAKKAVLKSKAITDPLYERMKIIKI